MPLAFTKNASECQVNKSIGILSRSPIGLLISFRVSNEHSKYGIAAVQFCDCLWWNVLPHYLKMCNSLRDFKASHKKRKKQLPSDCVFLLPVIVV